MVLFRARLARVHYSTHWAFKEEIGSRTHVAQWQLASYMLLLEWAYITFTSSCDTVNNSCWRTPMIPQETIDVIRTFYIVPIICHLRPLRTQAVYAPAYRPDAQMSIHHKLPHVGLPTGIYINSIAYTLHRIMSMLYTCKLYIGATPCLKSPKYFYSYNCSSSCHLLAKWHSTNTRLFHDIMLHSKQDTNTQSAQNRHLEEKHSKSSYFRKDVMSMNRSFANSSISEKYH